MCQKCKCFDLKAKNVSILSLKTSSYHFKTATTSSAIEDDQCSKRTSYDFDESFSFLTETDRDGSRIERVSLDDHAPNV